MTQTTHNYAGEDIEFTVPTVSDKGDFTYPCGPGTYIGKLVRYEHAPVSPNYPETSYLYLYWALHNTFDGPDDIRPTAFEADGKTPWCLRDKVSTRFGISKGGNKSKMRERAEVLLRREFGDGDKARISEMIGKGAILHLVWRTNEDKTKQFLEIKYLEPYRNGSLAPFTPMDDAAPAAADNLDLPF